MADPAEDEAVASRREWSTTGLVGCTVADGQPPGPRARGRRVLAATTSRARRSAAADRTPTSWPQAGEQCEIVLAGELGLPPDELASTAGDLRRLRALLRARAPSDSPAAGPGRLGGRAHRHRHPLLRSRSTIWASAATEAALILIPASIRDSALRRGYFPAGGPIEFRKSMSGLFNTGLLAVGRSGGEFVDWWCTQLARDCLKEPRAGMWTDQLWVEWATVYFEHKVLRDSSLNVGIWNLDERNLEAADGRPTVDGSPLRHFHFWGFDPRQPHLNSLYYEEARRNFERERGRPLPPQPTNPVLSDLVERYTEDLLRCGSEDLLERPYPYTVSAGGRSLELRERAIYREAVLAAEARGAELPPNPFDPARIAEFERMIEDPSLAALAISRGADASRTSAAGRRVAFVVHPRRQAVVARRALRVVGPLPTPGPDSVQYRFNRSRGERRRSARVLTGSAASAVGPRWESGCRLGFRGRRAPRAEGCPKWLFDLVVAERPDDERRRATRQNWPLPAEEPEDEQVPDVEAVRRSRRAMTSGRNERQRARTARFDCRSDEQRRRDRHRGKRPYAMGPRVGETNA